MHIQKITSTMDDSDLQTVFTSIEGCTQWTETGAINKVIVQNRRKNFKSKELRRL